jgi:hypothetical protein
MEWNETELNGLISRRVEESLSLEYKAAESLGRDNKRIVDITKDVSAFANSAGGILIYGMRQFNDEAREHLPEKIDPIDRRDFQKEWLEHVINTIQPRPNVIIHAVQISSAPHHAVYVVEVPQSSTAHQARDRRYHRRHNFEILAMEDYEVRDVMRRRMHPVVRTHVHIQLGKVGLRNRVIWRAVNESNIMARYVYSLVDIPMKITGTHVRFEDQTLFHDADGFTCWRLKPTNHLGRPLFPWSDIIAEFPFSFTSEPKSLQPADKYEWRFRDQVRYKTFADEMPFVEGEFPVADIVKRIDFD